MEAEAMAMGGRRDACCGGLLDYPKLLNTPPKSMSILNILS